MLHCSLVQKPKSGANEARQKRCQFGLWQPLLGSVLACTVMLSNTAFADGSVEELHAAALQRLHWAGLYPPGFNISIGKDMVATVSGNVETDFVKAEVEETVQMTDGIRGVIDELAVVP